VKAPHRCAGREMPAGFLDRCRLAAGGGHCTMVGTPAQIADKMEQWFHNEGADGFNLMPPSLPGGIEDFIDHVVPELQRRGLFRREYEGNTLRDHLRLARPGRI